MGILACIMLIGGYVPIPFELIKRRGRVIGIDFIFLAIDWSGAFFSLMSLGTLLDIDQCCRKLTVAQWCRTLLM